MLDLLDIVGTTGNEGGGGEVVHLGLAKGDHLGEHLFAEASAKAGSATRSVEGD